MKKILFLLQKKEKIDFLLIVSLVVVFSSIEIFIFSFLPIILSYFSDSGEKINQNFLTNFFISENFHFKYILIIFIFLFILRSIFSVFVAYKKSKFVQSVNDNLSDKIFNNYLNKDYFFFLNNDSSEFVSKIIIEIDKFAYRLLDSVVIIITELFLIAFIFCFLLLNYFLVTIFFVIIILFFFTIFYLFYKKIFKKFGLFKLRHDVAKVDDLSKAFFMILNIKLDNLQEYFRSRFKLNTQNSSKSTFVLSFINECSKPFIETVVVLLIFIILISSYYFFQIEKYQIFSMLSIFVIGMFRILPSANRILIGFNNIKFHTSSINVIYDQIRSVEAKKTQIQTPYSFRKAVHVFENSITLNNVNFYYDLDRPVLKNINLNIKKNQTIGIKGISGSGKTTLLNILCCLLKPTSGLILIDEKLMTEDLQMFYQKKIGYVSQKIYLFNDTLLKNIVFDKDVKSYNKELFKETIKAANLESLIENLGEAENTLMGERGIKFSGGQQQKIGIARALYKDTEILIFDEATSSLDKDSENDILNTIKDLKNKKTLVIVSHKDSSFIFCDAIYELKDCSLTKIK